MGEREPQRDADGQLEPALVTQIDETDEDAALEAVEAEETGQSGRAQGDQAGEGSSEGWITFENSPLGGSTRLPTTT